MKNFKSADTFFSSKSKWNEELRYLREILRNTELKEEVKWGMPVYTLDGKNVVGIGGFKEFFGIWFFQGALLKDKLGLLVNAQEGKTKALRQMRFRHITEIKDKIIMAYVNEAIENQKKGIRIPLRRSKPLTIPNELKEALSKDTKLNNAFEAMSLACKREYAEYISEAKKEETRQRRLEKIIPMIQSGGGLHDQYK